jgi:hypothetical protein
MNILFVDIETAPIVEHFKDLPADGQAAFTKKHQFLVDEGKFKSIDEIWTDRAALLAEYAKIVCIGIGSVGYSAKDEMEGMYLKALTGTETEILEAFKMALLKSESTHVCAHRGKEFDFPFMCRRMCINKIELPDIFKVMGKKPWEINWIDTAELWQFTEKKHYVSLITLCFVFGIPTPKHDLEGAQVPAAFYRGEITRIATYCLDDVSALINGFRGLEGKAAIPVFKKVLA